ncbi:MAG: hydantoinase B/oxoprolinase family protein, partial [Armatimonadetes bacterium]|nr:hydantoinase B/oxoprolinase family protein [Armatimonadota bacterium]
LTVIAPPGCILNARFPAATMSRYNTAAHIDAAISGCLAQAIPDRIMAQTGLQYTAKFYGRWPDGRAFGTMSIVGGGMGALGYKDGLTGTLFPSSASNCSVEVLEQRVPVVALEKEILTDSGGAGRWRGGCGQRVAYTLAPGQGTPVTISFSMRMIDHPAYGLLGGRSGGRGAMSLDGRALTRRDPELMDGCLVLQPGQVLRVDVGGGGGVGDPKKRDRALAASDLENEYISPDAAARDYGVG